MTNFSNQGRALRSAVTVVLCALFFLLAIGVVLLGSGVYRGTAAAADENFTHRTALGYLTNQIRRGDVEGGLSLGQFGDGDALFLRENGYVTILYCYEGQLLELFAEEGLDLPPDGGMPILPLASLTVEPREGCLRITATGGDGVSYSADLAPRCGWTEEVGP